MTSCAECLTALSTTRLADFSRQTALVAHCAGCAACAEALSDFQLAERRLASTLADLRPLQPSTLVASEAIAGSERLRRRTAARLFRAVLGLVGAVLLGSYLLEEVWRKQWPDVDTEIVPLTCITTEDATSIVTPFLRSNGAAVYQTPGTKSITIRGVEGEVRRAYWELKNFEEKYCQLPPRRGTDVIPGGEKPGKD